MAGVESFFLVFPRSQVCSKGFIRKDHMVKHVQTHTRRNALHQSAGAAAATNQAPPPPPQLATPTL